MNLLAIDTSTDACSVGLLIGSEIKFNHRVAARQHGALVLPMVDQLMSEAGISAKQLDGIAYGRGPGSFTGVRIGVAVTQGIALGADVGVIGLSTMQSIAQGCLRNFNDTHVAVSMDARMDEVYYCAYAEDDSKVMQAVIDEQVCAQQSIQVLPESCSTTLPTWRWAGSGAQRYSDIVKERFSVDDSAIRNDRWPHAVDLLSLALPRVLADEMTAAEHASPVYLRDKVAQTTAEREALK